MYQFSPATERILRMREIIRERIVRYDSERARIVTESNKKNEHVPPMIKRARLLYDLCEQMTILVEDTELIVIALSMKSSFTWEPRLPPSLSSVTSVALSSAPRRMSRSIS